MFLSKRDSNFFQFEFTMYFLNNIFLLLCSFAYVCTYLDIQIYLQDVDIEMHLFSFVLKLFFFKNELGHLTFSLCVQIIFRKTTYLDL